MNWDDLRYILAVHRHGTLKAAAAALRVSATTMTRRLRALEEAAGTTLFQKLKHGVELSPAGAEMVATAEEVEAMANALDARVRGLDARLQGSIRVTSVDILLRHWIGDFGAFCRRHPAIDLELSSSMSVANLTQREADVAVRVASSVPEHLLGNRYAEVHYAVFGGRSLVDAIGADAPYGDFPWLSWDPSISRSTDNWIERNARGARVALRVGEIALMVDAIRADLGITILPCVVGDADPKLHRVGPYLEGGLHVWVLTHPQLRGSARIRAFLAFMRELIQRDKDLIEGRRPQAGSKERL